MKSWLAGTTRLFLSPSAFPSFFLRPCASTGFGETTRDVLLWASNDTWTRFKLNALTTGEKTWCSLSFLRNSAITQFLIASDGGNRSSVFRHWTAYSWAWQDDGYKSVYLYTYFQSQGFIPLIPLDRGCSIPNRSSTSQAGPLLPPEDLWSMDLMWVMPVEVSHQE